MGLERITDRTGFTWAELEWRDGALVRLAVPGATVAGVIVRDPLLGDAHAIACERSTTTMSAIDWARPREIPAIAAPDRLSPGSGGAILNVIAVLARRAGVASLRYAGPYPTHELWRTLARSFRTSAHEADFTDGAIDRMIRIARDPMAIEFVPAPHDRVAVERGHVELRGAVERAVIDGVAYVCDGSPARLTDGRAELWFGDAPYARIATFADDGSIVEGPHAIPRCTSAVLAKPFPPALVVAIAELAAEVVAAPLAADVRAWLGSRSIRWDDVGACVARAERDAVVVHAAIWERVAPLGLGRLALALAEALAPVATRAVLDEVWLRSRG